MKPYLIGIVIIILTVTTILIVTRDKNKPLSESEIQSINYRNKLDQMTEDLQKDSSQIAWETDMRGRYYRLGYKDDSAEKKIVAFEDTVYLLDKYSTADTRRWYKHFKEAFHPKFVQ